MQLEARVTRRPPQQSGKGRRGGAGCPCAGVWLAVLLLPASPSLLCCRVSFEASRCRCFICSLLQAILWQSKKNVSVPDVQKIRKSLDNYCDACKE